jgi:hypothetical protein
MRLVVDGGGVVSAAEELRRIGVGTRMSVLQLAGDLGAGIPSPGGALADFEAVWSDGVVALSGELELLADHLVSASVAVRAVDVQSAAGFFALGSGARL